MKKVKDSQKRWKQLVTMLLVAALLVTGTPDVVGFASEGTQEQVSYSCSGTITENPGESTERVSTGRNCTERSCARS